MLPNASPASLALFPPPPFLSSSSLSALPLITIPIAPSLPVNHPPPPLPAELDNELDAIGLPARLLPPDGPLPPAPLMAEKKEWCGPRVGEGMEIGRVRVRGGRVRVVDMESGGGVGMEGCEWEKERMGEPPEAGETARRLKAWA